MQVIAKAGLCALVLTALVPAGQLLTGASSCATPQRDASVQELRRLPVPRIPQLKLPTQKTETQVTVHISGYGVVMSTKIAKSSGSPFVDMHAMTAARFSTYLGKIVNCQPVPSDLTISVPYDPNAPQPIPLPMRSLPPTPVPSGEVARPIEIIQGSALLSIHVAQPVAQRKLAFALPSPTTGYFGISSAGGVLYHNRFNSRNDYARSKGPVAAMDLETGKELWQRQSGRVVGATGRGVIVTIEPPASETQAYGHDIMAYLRAHKVPKLALNELDRSTGRTRFVLPGTVFNGTIDGVSFTQDGRLYSASSVLTGKLLWASNGGPSSPGFAPPIIHNGVLLQLGIESGALTEGFLYAFDLRTGRAKWSMRSNEQPLGFKGNVVYIDSTWFPQRMDYYLPMTIAAVDLVTGKQLDEYTYRPDPIQNATDEYRNGLLIAYVAGGYAYVTVNGKWYRYDAEREPAQARPFKLGALTVEGTFENRRLLVHDQNGAYIAESLPNSLKLHKFGDGDLRSKIVEREDGTRYAVFGNTLYAFDRYAGVRGVGAVSCASVYSIITWSGHAAVLCDSDNQSAATELLFNDRAEHIAALHITPQTPPPYRLQIREFQIPGSNPNGRTGQWDVGPMTSLPSGEIAITLADQMNNSVMYVSPSGHLKRVPIAPEIPVPTANPNPTPYTPGAQRFDWPPRQPSPTQLVADKRGTLWFNDVWRPNITSLSPSGELTTRTIGSGSGARLSSVAIKLAATRDGEVWYARSLPKPQIGRVDGSRMFDIPAQYGIPTVFLAGNDNTLWFFSRTALVHVNSSGHFVSVPVPSQLTDQRTGASIVTSGSNGTIWAAQRERIYHLGPAGVLGTYSLPDATLGVGGMALGCDGSLYVTPQYVGVLFRLRPNGVFERYQLPFFVTNIMRSPNCTLWFVQGTNYPTASVGTFKLVPR